MARQPHPGAVQRSLLGPRQTLQRHCESRRRILRGTVAEMVETAADLAAKAQAGQFTAAEFRDRLGNGRKVAIRFSNSLIVTA